MKESVVWRDFFNFTFLIASDNASGTMKALSSFWLCIYLQVSTQADPKKKKKGLKAKKIK